jgi:hypothetical protein
LASRPPIWWNSSSIATPICSTPRSQQNGVKYFEPPFRRDDGPAQQPEDAVAARAAVKE